MNSLILTLDAGAGCCLPIAYQQLTQGALYAAWRGSYPQLHDEGFAGDGQTFRLFTFGPLEGRYRVQGNEITFTGLVQLEVRSPVEDLLYALMLESYNDAAVMIAEHIGGSVEGFAAMMNEKAAGLGCGDTYFITPNGLDGVKTDEQGKEHIHSTTASDLARIMRYCVTESPAKDEFLKITQTQNHYFTDMAGKRSFNCYNHNAFLTMMEGVLSGKTGFTGGAGYSYVGAMENQGRTYVIALLGCGWPPHKTYKWSDARKLYTYGLEHFKMKDVFQEETFARVPVSGGLCWKEGEGAIDQVELSMMLNPDDMHLTLLMGEGEEARVVKKVPSILMAPVREGQQVGTVDYYLGEVLVKRFPVYAMQGVEKMNLRRAADRVLDLFLVR